MKVDRRMSMAPLVAGRSITHAGLVESGTAGELGVSSSNTNPTNQLFPSRFPLRSSSHQSIASITLLSPQQLPPTNCFRHAFPCAATRTNPLSPPRFSLQGSLCQSTVSTTLVFCAGTRLPPRRTPSHVAWRHGSRPATWQSTMSSLIMAQGFCALTATSLN